MQDGWHGKVDILVTCKNEDGLPVCIGEFTDDDDVSVSSDEVKSDEKFVGDSCAQIIAETIVFFHFYSINLILGN